MKRASIARNAADWQVKNEASPYKQPRRQQEMTAYSEPKGEGVEIKREGNQQETPNPVFTSSIYHETVCYEGMNHDPVDNYEKGDVSCRMCGLVLDEQTTVSDVEWAKNKTGVDLPAQLERHGDFSYFAKLMGNHCPETTLDFSNCKSESKQPQGKMESDAVKLLRKGYMSIRDLCDRLSVADEKAKDDAFMMLKKCYDKKMFNNETSMSRFVPVCVYIACLDSIPVFIWEVLDNCEFDDNYRSIPKSAAKDAEARLLDMEREVKDKKFKDTYHQIQKVCFGIEKREDIKAGDYLKSLERIVSRLGFRSKAFEIEGEARHILQRIRDLGNKIITCMNDDMLTSAAIYAAALVHGHLSREELKNLGLKLKAMFTLNDDKTLDKTYQLDILRNIDLLISKKELADNLRKLNGESSAMAESTRQSFVGGKTMKNRAAGSGYKKK